MTESHGLHLIQTNSNGNHKWYVDRVIMILNPDGKKPLVGDFPPHRVVVKLQDTAVNIIAQT